jgi:hypothetical protein
MTTRRFRARRYRPRRPSVGQALTRLTGRGERWWVSGPAFKFPTANTLTLTPIGSCPARSMKAAKVGFFSTPSCAPDVTVFAAKLAQILLSPNK